jgi:hypothetical protein
MRRALLGAALVLAACAGEADGPASIRILSTGDSLEVGATTRLRALAPEGIVDIPVAARWQSRRTDIVSVDDTGLATGRHIGDAWIVATVGNAADSILLSALTPVASITVSPDTAVTTVGWPAQFTAVLKDAAGNVLTGRLPQWSSSDTALASVAAAGAASGKAAGLVVITASTPHAASHAVLRVHPPVAHIDLTLPGDTADLHASLQATAVPRDQSGNALTGLRTTWSIRPVHAGTDTGVATIDSLGRIAPVTLGWFTVAATINGLTATHDITILASFDTVAGGWHHGCGLSQGTALCWGSSNLAGQLGRPEVGTYSDWPVIIPGGPWKSISFGDADDACALGLSGDTWCWGRNNQGQLGVTTTATCGPAPGVPCSPTPVRVPGIPPLRAISLGVTQSCGIAMTGDAWCWGYGTMGNGGAPDQQSAPVKVGGGHNFSAISVGHNAVCALDTSGTPWCWGDNSAGEAGQGDTATTHLTQYLLLPSPVVGGHTFTRLSLGRSTACGITSAGSVWCWGASEFGEVGGGTAQHCSNIPCTDTPVAVDPGTAYLQVEPALFMTCALTANHTLAFWGLSLPPQSMGTAQTFGLIDAADIEGCAGRATNGRIYWWEQNARKPVVVMGQH